MSLISTDELGFLGKILESPDDDAPRLVFADWLDERGDPRGEFIQVQVELANRPSIDRKQFACKVCGNWPNEEGELEHGRGCYTQSEDGGGLEFIEGAIDEKAEALRSRERELWNYGMPNTWVERIKPPFDCIQCIDEETISRERAAIPILVYRRGFIAQITCPGDQLAAVVDQVCPDLTLDCPQCVDLKRWANEWDCPTCHGRGTVARELTGAEQPVKLVRMTSWHPLPPYYHQSMPGIAADLDRHWPRRTWPLELPDGQRIEPPAKERVTT